MNYNEMTRDGTFDDLKLCVDDDMPSRSGQELIFFQDVCSYIK